ncbi:MAG: hypothetical protein J07HR59_00505 [Halorubrum sp. J07HR59]|nr:MAG: hypothetical protein J07HR59_00505 [Halorubrum sp. J07HR59]
MGIQSYRAGIHSQRPKGDSFRHSVARIPILSVYDGGETASVYYYCELDNHENSGNPVSEESFS